MVIVVGLMWMAVVAVVGDTSNSVDAFNRIGSSAAGGFATPRLVAHINGGPLGFLLGASGIVTLLLAVSAILIARRKSQERTPTFQAIVSAGIATCDAVIGVLWCTAVAVVLGHINGAFVSRVAGMCYLVALASIIPTSAGSLSVLLPSVGHRIRFIPAIWKFYVSGALIVLMGVVPAMLLGLTRLVIG